jgi:hypothetical protein
VIAIRRGRQAQRPERCKFPNQIGKIFPPIERTTEPAFKCAVSCPGSPQDFERRQTKPGRFVLGEKLSNPEITCDLRKIDQWSSGVTG